MADVETEAARMEREAKQKEEEDAAARREIPQPPHPMMHPDFQQYMRGFGGRPATLSGESDKEHARLLFSSTQWKRK